MNFLEAINELDEIYKVNESDDTDFYHYFQDLLDLVNSLESKSIYSNKNVRISQHDVYADTTESYVCMTTDADGKQRVRDHFRRPYGLSFVDLSQLCDRQHYRFDASVAYSQVAAKTQYSNSKNKSIKNNIPAGRPITSGKTKDGQNIEPFRDFRLLAIGKLKDGRCFISGGQGRNLAHHFYSKLFDYDTNADFYNDLRSWFLQNMTGKLSHAYYYFNDDTIGEPTQTFTYKDKVYAINTSRQKNPKYIPWVDTDNSKADESGVSHTVAMSFDKNSIHNVAFDEIIGIGPFIVEDQDGKVLLKMDMVAPGSKGGYEAPCILGANDITGEYFASNQVIQTGGQALSFAANEETAKKLYDLFNEHEYRVYVPGKHDLYFKPTDIKTLILPTQFKNSAYSYITLNIDQLVNILEADPNYNIESDKTSNINKFIQDGIYTIDKNNKPIPDILYNCTTKLIQLLTGVYQHVGIELYTPAGDIARTKLWHKSTYMTDENATDELPADGNFSGSNKLRYPIIDVLPDVTNAYSTTTQGKKTPSIVADLTLPGSNRTIEVRVGAEVIVIGKDAEGQKYILMVDGAHKTEDFIELPGGGLYKCSHNNSLLITELANLALHRLKFKGGLESNQLANFKDTEEALLLCEAGAAKKEQEWPYSYYRLFSAEYTDLINPDELDYNYDNKSYATTMKIQDEAGYICYLKWLPVNSLSVNRLFINRYANIIPLIKDL